MIAAKRFTAIGFLILALVFPFVALRRMMGQIHNGKENRKGYTAMAPLDRYLMDRNAEITLARSAAPESISRDATTLVLGRKGYETAIEGKNGCVCVVERSGTDSPVNVHQYSPQPITEFTISLSKWSDGTRVPDN